MNFANKGRNRVVYQSVWGDKIFPGLSIEANSEESPSSYRIVGKPEDAGEIIKAFYMALRQDLVQNKMRGSAS